MTLDVGRTLAELAKLGAYAAFFAAAVTYASRPDRRRALVLAVAGVATLVAIIGLAQAALGTTRVLFFYDQQQQHWGPPVRGTFVNANNFGALMALGAASTLVLGLRERRWRFPALAATLIINLAVVFSLSRSGIAGTMLAQLLTFALDRVQLWRSADQEGARRRSAFLIVALALIALALVIGASRLRSEISKTTLAELDVPTSKYQAWRHATELVVDYPWVGVGRGAFDQAFTRVSEVSGKVRYPYVENSWLQVVVDWGVPAALLLFLLAGWSAVLALRRLGEDPLAIGAAAGLAALAVHDVVDFSVDIPGVALPALALLAVIFGRTTRDPERGRRRLLVHPVAYLAPASLVTVMALGAFFPTPSAEAEALAAVTRDPEVPVERVLMVARAAQRRHPSDYFLHALVAERLARDEHPSTIRWLNHAIYLNPRYPDTHVIAAELLARNGRKPQALLEYRTAAASARNPRDVWERVLARYPALDDLVAACPEDAGLLALLAKWLDGKGRALDAEAVYLRVMAMDPRQLRAASELASRAIARGDKDLAAQRVAAVLAIDDGPGPQLLRARERILAGDLDTAARILAHLLDRSAVGLEVELALCDALARAGRGEDGRNRLKNVERHWALDRAGRIRLHETRAEIERRDGNEHQYQWELEQVRRLRNP
jgi:hypothetical protein